MPLDLRAIQSALEQAGVPRAAELAQLARESVRITPVRGTLEALPLGASRFGGAPDVPQDFVWPKTDDVPLIDEGRELTFLAQLDLAQLARPELPRSGWLLFFYDALEQPWGFDPNDRGSARVIHLDVPREHLVRRPHPSIEVADAGPFEACALEFATTVDLPSDEDSVIASAGLELAPEHLDAYESAAAALNGHEEDGRYHHLLGHPQLVQGDMRRECELVSHGIYCGKPEAYRTERARALLPSAAHNWELLLQLDSDEDAPGWMWGDVGRIYFWIKKDELAAHRFEDLWLVLQCG